MTHPVQFCPHHITCLPSTTPTVPPVPAYLPRHCLTSATCLCFYTHLPCPACVIHYSHSCAYHHLLTTYPTLGWVEADMVIPFICLISLPLFIFFPLVPTTCLSPCASLSQPALLCRLTCLPACLPLQHTHRKGRREGDAGLLPSPCPCPAQSWSQFVLLVVVIPASSTLPDSCPPQGPHLPLVLLYHLFPTPTCPFLLCGSHLLPYYHPTSFQLRPHYPTVPLPFFPQQQHLSLSSPNPHCTVCSVALLFPCSCLHPSYLWEEGRGICALAFMPPLCPI